MAAEALGIASSITALAGAAVAAFRVSESMYNIARRVRHVRDEIEMFAMEIEAFANLLKTANFSLDRRIKALDTQSPTLRYLQDNEVLVQLNKYSRRVTSQVKKLKGPILSIESSIPFWTRFKWMYQKRAIDSSTSMMLGVESKLNIVLHVLSLEGAYQRGDSDEIEELKRQIKVHLRTIEILQERQERQTRDSEDFPGPIELSPSTDNTQDFVVELGLNMVGRGTVPINDSRQRHGRRSESRSTASTNHSHNAAPISTISTNSSHPHQLRHTGSLVRRRNSPLQSDRVNEPFEVSRTMPLEPRIVIWRSQGNSLLAEIQEDHSAESDSENDTASVGYTNTDSGTDNDEEIISYSAPTIREESNFIPVQPHSYLLDFNPDTAMESVSGYIVNDHGRKVSQTALLDPALPQNLISLAHASQLGCALEPQDGEENIPIDLGNGEIKRSGGQVVLQWGQGIHRATFPVRCLVYEHDVRDLVFGKPFLENASYIWPDAKHTLKNGVTVEFMGKNKKAVARE